MNPEKRRVRTAILRILAEDGGGMGSAAVARDLQAAGTELRPRMVRNYLMDLDRMGYTENLGRGGRRITEAGRAELEKASAAETVGLAAARIDELVYRMSLDPGQRSGAVVVNASRIRAADFPTAAEAMAQVMTSGLAMGRLAAAGGEGERFAGGRLAYGEVGVATVCSVTLNGAFRLAGIPMHSRFGGLLEMRDHRPLRFTQIIHYEGTTIDPLQVFIKGKMTRVREATLTGAGVIGAGFREIPAVALPEAGKVIRRLETLGLGCVLAVGRPGRPLFDVPVSPGRVGLVVAAGLNAMAAIEEAGIETHNQAMACLLPFESLVPAESLAARMVTSPDLQRRLATLSAQDREGREHGLFE